MKSIKRIVLVAVVAVLSVSTAFAGPRFGIKAGMNFNKLHLSNVQDNFKSDNGLGYTFGVMTEFTLPVVGLGVDASVMFSHMGSGVDEMQQNAASTDATTSGSKNFFEVPLNVKYKFGLIPNLKPYVFTGPSFAFKLGGNDDVFKTKIFQCAWNIGLGLELFKHVQVGASYGIGMNNVFEKVTNVSTTTDYKVKNNYWTVTAAYLF